MGIALNLAVFTPVYYVLYILSIRIHADKYSSESGMKGILPKILQFVIGSLVQISNINYGYKTMWDISRDFVVRRRKTSC